MRVNRNLAAALAATVVIAGCGDDKKDGATPVGTPTVAQVTKEITVTVGPGKPKTNVKTFQNATGVQVNYELKRPAATHVQLINNGIVLNDITLKPDDPVHVILQQVQAGLLTVVVGKQETDIKITQ